MVCFNVACSVSNLSIGCGDRVVYIPLIPSNWYRRLNKEPHLVGTHSGLIYSNCYFTPLTLPVKGHYNDYGGIDEVDRDANTEAIEKFFNMPIEDFVNTVERNWCREYLSDQKDITKNFLKKPELFNNVSKSDLTKEFMNEMGFEETEKANYYTFKDFPYLIKTRFGAKTEGYYILDKETEKEVKQREHNGFYRNYLLSDFAELTGYYIGISKEMQDKISIMENLSGMFIHEDIYNLLAKGSTRAEANPDEVMIKELGFVLDEDKKRENRDDRFYYHPEVEDNESYVCIGDYGSPKVFDKDTRDEYYGDWLDSSYELAENYLEKHGVVLDLTPYEKESSSMPSFRNLQKNIKLYKAIQEEVCDPNDEVAKIRASLNKLKFWGHPLSGTNLRNDGLWAFEGWSYLEDIYSAYFEDGSIAKEFCEWNAAKGMMYSANVFFFPAMNGEQHGNDSVSKKVLTKSLEIIEEREKKWREENCCPSCGTELGCDCEPEEECACE